VRQPQRQQVTGGHHQPLEVEIAVGNCVARRYAVCVGQRVALAQRRRRVVAVD
jgi:hypothetical protein